MSQRAYLRFYITIKIENSTTFAGAKGDTCLQISQNSSVNAGRKRFYPLDVLNRWQLSVLYYINVSFFRKCGFLAL